MRRSRLVAIWIGLTGLVAGWVFLQAMTGRVEPESQPYVETVGFAVSTPGGLVFLTYLSGVFDFERYYGERPVAALFGDFFLAILAAIAVGVPATVLVREVTTSATVLFVVSAFATFTAAFGVFLSRTRAYFDWEQAA